MISMTPKVNDTQVLSYSLLSGFSIAKFLAWSTQGYNLIYFLMVSPLQKNRLVNSMVIFI